MNVFGTSRTSVEKFFDLSRQGGDHNNLEMQAQNVPLMSCQTESNWNDSMTRFLLSLPGGYSAIPFSFQAGDTFYVKLAPCWHG